MDFKNITFDKASTDFVIYHANCCDGFGSAYSIWKYMQLNNITHPVTYHPAKHLDAPPNITGKNVVICDFSYNYETMLEIINRANSVLILDHHKSAEIALQLIPKKYKYFNMNHSGAVITWQYFNSDLPIPKFILYIEDRDIWKKELEYCDEVHSVFVNVPMEFSEYDKYFNSDISELIETGRIIKNYNNIQIKQICDNAILHYAYINGKQYLVAYINTNVLKSDIGNYLITRKFPNADFSAVYHFDDILNKTIYSLRSTDEKTDVSIIAKNFGCGGHRNASGVSFDGFRNRL
jgi:oligoribonuclease NrnB/cAMP/cGMP phosphodiesterase (DHH superfamily)